VCLSGSRSSLTYPYKLFLDPYVLHYANCSCSAAMNASSAVASLPLTGPPYFNFRSLQCEPCPENSFCISSTDTFRRGASSIAVASGFYPVSPNTGSLVPYADTLPPPLLLSCTVVGACNPNASPLNSRFQCADGRDESALLCSRCLPRHYEVDSVCVACPTAFAALVCLAMIAIAIGLVVFVLSVNFDPHGSALLSISLMYLQVTSILQSQTAQSGASSNTSTWQSLGGLQALFSFRPWVSVSAQSRSNHCTPPLTHAVSLQAIECVVGVVHSTFQFWFMFSCLLALLCCWLTRALCLRNTAAAADSKLRASPSPAADALSSVESASSAAPVIHPPQPSLVQKAGFGIIFLTDLLYLPLLSAALMFFQCDNYSEANLSFVRALPAISCHSSEYRGALAASVLVVIALGLAFPAFIFRTLRSYGGGQGLDDAPFRTEFGFLWVALNRDMWWWSIGVGYGRKALLAIFLTQFAFRSIFVPVLVFSLLSGSVLLVVAFKPYRVTWENRLEVAVLSLAAISYLESILSGVGSQYFTQSGFSVLLLVLNTGMKLALAGLLVYQYAVSKVAARVSKGSGSNSSFPPLLASQS
jgi:hypothetical protein